MAELTDARLSAHWAVQVASAAGATLGEAREDYGHTNLTWSDEHAALVGNPLPDGRAAGVRLLDLTLLVTGTDAALSLEGRSVEEAMSWLGEQLGAPLTRPSHEMPDPPGRFGAGSSELSMWFETAHREIGRAVPGRDVRCWPHHFDVAALLPLDGDSKSEKARSVGVGMTPGDATYPRPYWYVTPWPYPEGLTLPSLPGRGTWHMTDWIGAVLNDVDDPAEIGAFLDVAIVACEKLAGA